MDALQQGRLLVVGAGMATAYLLEELAQHAHDWDITVIGEEPRACYNRVLLSSLLAGEVSTSDLDMLPAQSIARFVCGTQAESLDCAQQRVTCTDGSTFDYDALVIATGASVALPAFASTEGDTVRVVRTVADVEALRALPEPGAARGAVVVGGGLLGLEAAHGLNELGFATTVLHRNPTLMNRQLDREGGQYLQRTLEHRGLVIRTAVSPVALRHDSAGALCGLRLDDGSDIDCAQLVFATGILPRAELAQKAGVHYDRGILVDERMRTSTANIFALGECCQYGEQTFGLVAPVRAQAAVLARTLCSAAGSAFVTGDWPVQLKISGVDIFSAGSIDSAGEQIVLRDPVQGIYRRLVVRNNHLVGAMLVGDRTGSTWFAQLIAEQQDISALRQGLMFGRDVAEALHQAAA